MSENPTYNHRDIQRYLQHQMSVKEMYAFEKEMMNDPFLADAMEGFETADHNVSAQHLQSIKNKIRDNEEPAKVIALPQKKNNWWRVAALVLVLASIGLITYRLTDVNRGEMTAQDMASGKLKDVTLQTDTVKTPGTFASPNADLKELIADKDAATQQPILAVKPKPASLVASKGLNDTNLIVMNAPVALFTEKADEVSTAKEEASMAAPSARMERKADKSAAMQTSSSSTVAALASNEFVGKVVDPSGDPLPFASIRAVNTNIGTVTDAQGRFTLRAPDTVLNINIQSIGYAATKAKISSNKNADAIVLQQSETSLSEVVVTNMTRISAQAKKQASDGAVPAEGWNKFYQYLNIKIDSLRTANYALNNQDVELEFNVDKEGRPTSIRPTHEAAKEVTENAISIIKNGPSWTKPAKNKKTKLRIKF